jgi:hypothetical protein
MQLDRRLLNLLPEFQTGRLITTDLASFDVMAALQSSG